MGKEIIKPTATVPDKPRGKTSFLRLRIANAGLVIPLALGALPFLNGCSQEPSQPPQFPPTDTDRPLQKSKKQEPIPVRLPTTVPREKSIEQGWLQFKSTTLPYQINYPNSYTEHTSLDLDDYWRGDEIGKEGIRVNIGANPIKNRLTLDEYKEQEINYLKGVAGEDFRMKGVQSIYIDGQKAWKIEYEIGDFPQIRYIFLRDGKAWKIGFYPNGGLVFEKELPTFQKMLDSFTILPSIEAKRSSPASTPKTPEGKISISKKPDALYKSLLTTPIQDNILPPGMSQKGNSLGNLDATARALKAIAQINIAVSDNDPQFRGVPNGGLSYIIYPSVPDAKTAYDVLVINSGQGRRLTNFSYPATIALTYGVTVVSALVENVHVVAMFANVGSGFSEEKVVKLVKAGIAHLQKVGR